jgi:hypothetical protein
LCNDSVVRSIDALNLAGFIYKVLQFAPSSTELGKYIEQRCSEQAMTYQPMMREQAEIAKVMKDVIPFPLIISELKPEQAITSQFDQTQTEIYNKLHYQNL